MQKGRMSVLVQRHRPFDLRGCRVQASKCPKISAGATPQACRLPMQAGLLQPSRIDWQTAGSMWTIMSSSEEMIGRSIHVVVFKTCVQTTALQWSSLETLEGLGESPLLGEIFSRISGLSTSCKTSWTLSGGMTVIKSDSESWIILCCCPWKSLKCSLNLSFSLV